MTSRSSRARPLVLLAVLATVLAVGAGSFVSPAVAGRYTPPAGVTTNNPLGDRTHQRAIISQIIRTIYSTPRGGKIRIASWNIRSTVFEDALIDAHKRGVSVRVILDRGNANPDYPNPGVDRLQRVLSRYGNSARPPGMRSQLRKCAGSCRGRGGIAHSKFYLFRHAGHADYIVMNGSANATDLAANAQWNDIYTVLGRRALYREYLAIFDQMFLDRPVAQGYVVGEFGGITTMFYPYTGRGTRTDPIIRELNQVRCLGALNTGDGHTMIRAAVTSMSGDRGKLLAWKIRRLANQGCHVMIVYAVMGTEVLRILRTGGPSPVPVRHIVQDRNQDGVYDRYLHMKVMTVRGFYAGNPRAWMTINGSANWSPVSLGSDEALMKLFRPQVVKRYNGWIDYLFHHPPPFSTRATPTTSGTTERRMGPNSQIQTD